MAKEKTLEESLAKLVEDMEKKHPKSNLSGEISISFNFFGQALIKVKDAEGIIHYYILHGNKYEYTGNRKKENNYNKK